MTRIQTSVSCELKNLPSNIDDDVILKNLRSFAESKLADDLSLLAIASVMNEHICKRISQRAKKRGAEKSGTQATILQAVPDVKKGPRKHLQAL